MICGKHIVQPNNPVHQHNLAESNLAESNLAESENPRNPGNPRNIENPGEEGSVYIFCYW
jgi:hypothetical protein